MLRGPLYFVVVSARDEPEAALREQLLWIYQQIVSIITASQLYRIFDKHGNFDLRRLLGGTEVSRAGVNQVTTKTDADHELAISRPLV